MKKKITMAYEAWLKLYLSQLEKKIKSHPFGLNYSEDYVKDLCHELIERGGFGETDGNWEHTTVENAITESFQLWINDYFCYDDNTKVYNPVIFSHDITLLDYFAAQAINKFIDMGLNFENASKASYCLAKSMLAEREKAI